MKFQFINIGKPHDEAFKKAVDDFTKRINNYHSCEWLIIPPVKNAAALSEPELKKRYHWLRLATSGGEKISLSIKSLLLNAKKEVMEVIIIMMIVILNDMICLLFYAEF